jgi:hypothetical protein
MCQARKQYESGSAALPKRLLTFTELYGVIFQKTEFFKPYVVSSLLNHTKLAVPVTGREGP